MMMHCSITQDNNNAATTIPMIHTPCTSQYTLLKTASIHSPHSRCSHQEAGQVEPDHHAHAHARQQGLLLIPVQPTLHWE
jgi:hypothetical protein